MHDVDDSSDAKLVPGLGIYRYDAPLCFANAEEFRHRALAAVDEWDERGATPVRWFVLNAEANCGSRSHRARRGRPGARGAGCRGIVFAMARVKADLRDDLDAAGLTAKIGAQHLYLTLPTAVEAYRKARSVDPWER